MRWLLAGIMLVAAGLRLALLGWSGLRLDEAFTWWVAADSGRGVLETVVAADTHPPLFYLLQRAWLTLGEGLAWARLPSAIFGVATVPVLYAIGRTVKGPVAGLVAAGLLAVSPWHLWHSQDARGYSLLTLMVGLMLLAAARTITVGDRRGAWAALFAGAGGVAVLTHNVAIVLVASIAIPAAVTLIRQGRRRAAPWFAACGFVLAVSAAWLPSLVRQAANLEQNLAWVEGQLSWVDALTATAAGWVGAPPASGGEVGLAVVVSALVAVGGVWALRAQRGVTGVVVGLLVLLPLVEAVSMFTASPLLVVRTLLPTSLALFLLLAIGLSSTPRRMITAAGGVGLAAVLVVGLGRLHGAETTSWEPVTTLLESETASNETVLYLANVGKLATDWLGDVPGEAVPLPGDFEQRLVWDEQVTREGLARATGRVPTGAAVWLVYSHGDRLDPDGHVLRWLDRERQREVALRYGGIEVIRYGAADPYRRSWNFRAPAVATTSRPSSSSE